ncbi:MAG: hypothetical protein V3U92_15610 [Cellulophaga sp.]
MTIDDFLKIKHQNISDVERFFSDKIKNLNELHLVLLKYSIPFFKNDENDLLYYGETTLERQNEIIIFENNSSLFLLFDGILTLLADANYLAIKMLQRSIFEFLIVNNHLILTQDFKYVDNWVNGKDIKIVKNILKRTDNEKSSDLIRFWVTLSKQSHASPMTTQSGLDMNETYGEYIDNIFTTYILLYFYNYQLRELYFPFMQSVYKKMDINIKIPYKSDWFKKKDLIRELERPNNNENLYQLIEAFEYKWKLKK